MRKIIISLCMYTVISFCFVSVLSAETTSTEKAEVTPTEKAEATPTEKAETTPTEKAETTPTEKAEAAPTKVIEGYGNLPWGSSIEDVKKQYENLEESIHDDLSYSERFFEQINQSNTRYFRFYNDQLYWTKIIYMNTTLTTAEVMVEKLVEAYGYFNDRGEYKKDNITTDWVSRNYSSKLKIVLSANENELVNNIGNITSSFLTVEYFNPKTVTEIDANEKNRVKDEIEL